MTEAVEVALRTIDPVELGRRIKTARIERRMTQSAMAASFASVGYVSRIESGQRRPDIDVLEGLSRNLGITAHELLFGDATPLRARVRLELDYAELELASGAADAARTRLAAIGTITDESLAHTAALVSALASEALGEDPVPQLRDLALACVAHPTLWLRTEISLCRALRESGEVEAAIRAGETAIAQHRDAGLPPSVESVQLALTLASAFHVAGDYGSALGVSRQGLRVAEGLADHTALVSAYWSASTTASLAGDIAGALEMADLALVYLDRDADVLLRARLLANIGMFQTRADVPQLEDAMANLTAAAALMESTPATAADVDRLQIALAQVHRLAGRFAEALGVLDRVSTQGEATNPHIHAEALLIRGQVLHESGQSGAADAFSAAVLAASALGVDRALANFWYEIAATLESTGDASGAIDAYKRAAISAGAVPYSQMERSTTPA